MQRADVNVPQLGGQGVDDTHWHQPHPRLYQVTGLFLQAAGRQAQAFLMSQAYLVLIGAGGGSKLGNVI